MKIQFNIETSNQKRKRKSECTTNKEKNVHVSKTYLVKRNLWKSEIVAFEIWYLLYEERSKVKRKDYIER